MTIFLVGDFNADRKEALRLAVMRADEEPVFCRDGDAARASLAEPDLPIPRCVYVDASVPRAEGLVAWMRGAVHLFSVPVVAIVPSLDDHAFVEAHAYGADDVIVAGDDAGMTVRVENLRDFDPSVRQPMTQGSVVVAHATATRRKLVGRILRQAGFDVSFAADEGELMSAASMGNPRLIVASEPLLSAGGLATVEQLLRTIGTDAPGVILLAEAKEVEPLRRGTRALSGVAVSSEHAPPDNLLFLANELLRPDVKNLRSSPRVLYGAVCSIRAAGTRTCVHGLSYNISGEGLFVRTLASPSSPCAVWLELTPPGRDRIVHLRGHIVWRRGLATGAGGATPPGCGIRLDLPDSPPGDREIYLAAYEELLGGERRAA